MSITVLEFESLKEEALSLIKEGKLSDTEIARKVGLGINTIKRLHEQKNVFKIKEKPKEPIKFKYEILGETISFDISKKRKPPTDISVTNVIRLIFANHDGNLKPSIALKEHNELAEKHGFEKINQNTCNVVYYRVKKEYLKGIFEKAEESNES